MALTPKPPQSPEDKAAERNALQQDILLREVDEAVRQDEATQFAKRYGRVIGAVMVVGLLAFAGYLWWSDNREGNLEQGSEQFVSALDELGAGNTDAADQKLASLAADGAPAAAAGAAMLRAGLVAQKGDTAGAAKMFEAIAADDNAPQEYRNLATIRAVATGYDTMTPEDVIARLKTLATPGNPWFASAAELVAMAYLKQGKKDLAAPLFGAIAQDEKAPATARSRARQMSGLLGYDAIEDVDQTLAEMQASPPEAGGAAPTAQ